MRACVQQVILASQWALSSGLKRAQCLIVAGVCYSGWMQLQVINPFPFPGTEWMQREELVLSQRERAQIARTLALLEEARELVGPESDDGLELAKAAVVLEELLG